MAGEWLSTEVAGAKVLARTVSRSGSCLRIGGGRVSEVLAALSEKDPQLLTADKALLDLDDPTTAPHFLTFF